MRRSAILKIGSVRAIIRTILNSLNSDGSFFLYWALWITGRCQVFKQTLYVHGFILHPFVQSQYRSVNGLLWQINVVRDLMLALNSGVTRCRPIKNRWNSYVTLHRKAALLLHNVHIYTSDASMTTTIAAILIKPRLDIFINQVHHDLVIKGNDIIIE